MAAPAILTAALAAALATLALLSALPAIGRTLTDRWRELDRRFRRVSDDRVTAASGVGGLILAGLVLLVALRPIFGPWVVVPLTGFAFVGPRLAFDWLDRRMKRRFRQGLPATLQLLAGSARAGRSLQQCLEDAAASAPRPVCSEMARVAREAVLRSDIGEALEASRQRMGLDVYDLMIATLLVNREKGGPLTRTLEAVADAMKELLRLEEQIWTASAEARKAAQIVAVMPPLVIGFVMLAQPDIVDKAVGSALGIAITIAACIVFALGVALLMRIMRIEI